MPVTPAASRRLPAASLLGWAALLVVITVRFAEPFQDGDLYWHMAYAKQMLARGTLILDHRAFSWTPASNEMIYCAWAAELALYWLWKYVGSWSLFALRYIVVISVAALGASHARRAGAGTTIFTPLVLILLVLSSGVGTLIKPELFSFLFAHVALWLYFRAKLERLDGADPVWSFYLMPALLVVWVNCHGAFMLIAPFLAATAIGELLNARLSPGLAFSPRSVKHLITGWGLCAVAVMLTPYGPRYPVQLFEDYVLGWTPRPDVRWNAAHRAVFDPAALPLHLAEFTVVLVALLVVMTILLARTGKRGGRIDWAVVFMNAGYLALFLPQLRTTYLWPAVVTYSAFYLLRASHRERPDDVREWLEELPAGQAMGGLAIGLMLFVSARSIYEARYRPFDRSWLGFGTSDINPVAEAEFLAAARLGPPLYNIFDSGGYLIWRLDPAYKVMVDQRSFPYLSWFEDQYRFSLGESFEPFLRKYPADVALIDLAKEECVGNFLKAPDWRLAYYGPTAAVFIKQALTAPAGATTVAPDRFNALRNPSTAVRVFQFAVQVADFPTAWKVLEQMETYHRWSMEPGYLQSAIAYREAHRALRAGDFPRAHELFGEWFRDHTAGAHDAEIMDLLRRGDSASKERLTVLAAPD